MKKKLLITLGCSFTEGVGIYDYSIFPQNKDIYDKNIPIEIIRYQLDLFHELGWPNKLGKKLGYHKVLNLGSGGASSSGNLKSFMEKYRNHDFSEWDVTLIWWLPQASRVSFYSGGKVDNILPTLENKKDTPEYHFNKFYITITEFYDYILEQTFYLKLMEDYCKLKGFDFLWFSSEYNNDELPNLDYDYLFPIHNWIGTHVSGVCDYLKPPYINKSCGHPNEEGYNGIANLFFNSIKDKHPHLINENKPMDMEWEWNGSYISYYPSQKNV